jgi:chemotaxis protein methyltransferase CheR
VHGALTWTMTSSEPISSDALVFSDRSFARFCRLMTDELGIKTSEAKRPMLQSRLQRRIRELGLPSFDAYCDFLFESPLAEEERIHFIDAVTTNKTDFFREPGHFDHLVRHALPEMDPASGMEPESRPWRLKAWCAGCSSGEEVYTLAIVLAEHGLRRPGFDYSILGTDISTRVLAHASRAVYASERIEPVAPMLRAKYFLRSKDPARDQVRIVPALRSRVGFHRLNFMERTYPVADQFQAIFFRNVMIYFDKATQEAVVNKLCRHLAPGGYLFVGHSESLAGLDLPVESLGSSVYRKTG